MIRLSFASQHKSILSFDTTDLATDFVVITGINGAGKTHLLEAIESGHVRVQGIPARAPHIRRFHHSNMQPNDSRAANPSQLWEQRTSLWNEVSAQVEQQKSILRTNLLGQGVPSEELVDLKAASSWSVADLQAIVHDPTKATQLHKNLQQWLEQADEQVWNTWTQHPQRMGLARTIRQRCGRCVGLTEEAFYEQVPVDWTPTDVFQQNFASLFAGYYRRFEENRMSRFYALNDGENTSWMDDDAFAERFGGPPWETVNEILETAQLPVRVNHPTGRYDQPFTLKLRHVDLDCDVAYSNLSSGEKIIMSLAHCLYYARSGNLSLTLPQLLLLDEPDAPLHPAMAKSFMDVIEQVLVRDHGVKVIMTTHSPSTVAFAPDGAIYTLERSPRRLIPSSRDAAISILTDGFATVMPSTRFVIVEAAFDQDVYQTIYDTIAAQNPSFSAPPLVFVPASDRDNQTGGGSGQVSNWAEKLTSSGLTFFRGVLDRDADNAATEIVLVLGRYSIENYLLDPIAIYACLVEKNLHANVMLTEEIWECNVHLLSTLEDEALQRVADAVFTRIQEFRPQLASSKRFAIEYRNGRKITAPVWFRDERGHDLSTIVRECFRDGDKPVFSRNLEELKLMICAKLPGFIPSELEKLFRELAG